MAGKGGKLDGVLTEEMVDSSKTILQSYRGRGTTGLQQFFSPPEAASLIHEVFGERPVVDLTAGAGALLDPFKAENRFGIEIDPEYAQCPFNCITADIQKAFPLLQQIGFRADAFALNPPWGLRWSDERFGSNINSAVLTFLYALELMSIFGQGVLIAGKGRFQREMLAREEGKKFYAIISCNDLFDDADVESVIAFFSNQDTEAPVELDASRAELPGLAEQIKEARSNVPHIYIHIRAGCGNSDRDVDGC